MNKLITTLNGGFPLRSNDFRFIDDSVREALKGLASIVNDVETSEAIILSGCNKTTDGFIVTLSPGYMSIGGEVCYFPGQTYSNVGLPKYLKIVDDVFDPAGTKTFKNDITHESYQIRTAKIVASSGTIPEGYTNVNDLKYAFVVLKNKILVNSDWQDLPEATSDYLSDVGNAQYMKDANGFVHLRGEYSNEDPMADGLIGSLPTGFRPSVPLYFYCFNGTTHAKIKINTDGTIVFVGAAIQTVNLSICPAFRV